MESAGELLQSLVREYNNIQEEFKVKETVLAATNDELLEMQVQHEALLERHDQESREVDELNAQLLALFGRGSPNALKRSATPPYRLEDTIAVHHRTTIEYDRAEGSVPTRPLEIPSTPITRNRPRDPSEESIIYSDSDVEPTVRRTPGARNVHKHYPLLHAAFGSVVRVNRKAMAISCFLGDCRANAHGPVPAYFQGIRGLQSHIRQSHPGHENLSLHHVAKKCTKVELSADDAVRVEHGRPPRTAIDFVFKDGGRIEGIQAKNAPMNERELVGSKRRRVLEEGDVDDQWP